MLTTTAITRAPRWWLQRRIVLTALTLVVALVAIALVVRSSGDDRADPARTALVDGAGLTPRTADCILEGAGERGVDVVSLRRLILDPGADATLSQTDQRAVNEVARSCLAG